MLSHKGVALFERIGRIKRGGLIGGSVYLGVALRFQKPKPSLQVLSLTRDQDSTLSSPYTHTHTNTYPPHAPCHNDNHEASKTVSEPQLSTFLCKSCLGPGVSAQRQNNDSHRSVYPDSQLSLMMNTLSGELRKTIRRFPSL